MMRSTEVSGMLSNPGAVYQAKVVARGIRRGGENGKGGECGVEGGIALWRIHMLSFIVQNGQIIQLCCELQTPPLQHLM